MKNRLKLGIALGIAISQLSFGQSLETVTFGVKGNCGMCKSTIEKAAKIKGVSQATWDVDKKEIEVSYNPDKTKLLDIHNSIANAGYDTEKAKSTQEAYNSLHGCCQYDPNMKIGGDKK